MFISVVFIVAWVFTFILESLNKPPALWALSAAMFAVSVFLSLFYVIAFALLGKDIDDFQ